MGHEQPGHLQRVSSFLENERVESVSVPNIDNVSAANPRDQNVQLSPITSMSTTAQPIATRGEYDANGMAERPEVDRRRAEEVRHWLRSKVHSIPAKYVELLIDNGFDNMDMISAITQESDLIDIGMESQLYRQLIVNAVCELNNNNVLVARASVSVSVVEGGRDRHNRLQSNAHEKQTDGPPQMLNDEFVIEDENEIKTPQ
mmetsp:Transcript_29885/g.48677  ORF Transcript_29885/g.48677 Transcript_29885/m.48677 type:complete len:202 (-) Transcript_29885:108-713(-)